MGFADGFQAGSGAMMRGLQMRADREDRERERQYIDEQRTRARMQQGREDAAWNNLQGLQDQGVYEGATGLKQSGMQQLATGGSAYGSGEGAIREATGDYAREAGRMGLPDQGGYNPQADIARRGATEMEVERAYGGLATARRDVKGMRDSTDRQRTLREQELIAKAEVNDDTIKFLNQNHKALTLGDADKDGFRPLSYVDVDGKGQFARLSKAEQKKLAAAQALWDVNPERAMKMVGEVNKGLADVFEAENKTVETGGRWANDVASKRGALGQDRERTGISKMQLAETARHHRVAEGNDAARTGLARQAAERANWMPEQYIDEQGQVRVFDVNRKSPGQPQFAERQMPTGLKPYNPRPPAEVRSNPDGSVTRGSELWVPDPKRPGQYTKVDFGPSATEKALTEFLARKQAGGAGQGTQQAGGLPTRPLERYAPFEAMDDVQLQEYARAGNVLAKDVLKRRAAEPVDPMGFSQGY